MNNRCEDSDRLSSQQGKLPREEAMSRSTRMTLVLAMTLLSMWLIWQGLAYNSSATTTATPWVSG